MDPLDFGITFNYKHQEMEEIYQERIGGGLRAIFEFLKVLLFETSYMILLLVSGAIVIIFAILIDHYIKVIAEYYNVKLEVFGITPEGVLTTAVIILLIIEYVAIILIKIRMYINMIRGM